MSHCVVRRERRHDGYALGVESAAESAAEFVVESLVSSDAFGAEMTEDSSPSVDAASPFAELLSRLSL